MKSVAILTDFVSHDPAYSLCGVVANQVKMLVANGYMPRLIVRSDWDVEEHYPGAEGLSIDPGEIGNNVVNITKKSPGEIDSLVGQLSLALAGGGVVLTHDLIYQANMWKYHVAARRIAKTQPNIKWLHWVHSSTDLGTVNDMGKFKDECRGMFPNSRLVAMHPEEINRKGSLYGYERDQIVIIPNPVDLTEDFHPLSKHVVKRMRLFDRDVIAVYPARLDRGKQVHMVIEIFEKLRHQGWDAVVVVIDFHSTAGDKAKYREEMLLGREDWVFFTSNLPEGSYHIPHKAVMDLFEYGDFLVHPSRSESDPLTIPEAMWKRCGLMLNFDLPVFRQYDGRALFGKFSSAMDVHTGMPGETATSYDDRGRYMDHLASAIAYEMQNNPVLYNHAAVRKDRSLEAVARKHLIPAIEGGL